MGTELQSATTILKWVQLFLSLIVMLMGRTITGATAFATGYVPYGDPDVVDENIVGDMVAYGFFFIILAQTISIRLGEKPFTLHLILDTVGGLGYLVIGSLHLYYWVDQYYVYNEAPMLGAGSVCIFTGLALWCGAWVWYKRMDEEADN